MRGRRRTDEEEAAGMLPPTVLNRKVGVLEDMLEDAGDVGDVVELAVVEEVSWSRGRARRSARRSPSGRERKRDAQDTESLPGLYMDVTRNSARWKKLQHAR